MKNITTIFVLMALSTSPYTEQSNENWKILVGSGQSHVGWGGTKETVKTYDLIFQHETIKPSTEGSKYRKSFI